MIRSAVFRADGTPRKILIGLAHMLNDNIAVGEVWREVPEDVVDVQDVPALEDLPVHPSFVAKVAP